MVKVLLARAFLRATGWAFEGELPREERFVLIAAPHTSNWDFVYMLAIAWSVDVDLAWMGKDTLFRWPFGRLMRRLGGMPIRRDLRTNVVEQSAARFAAASRLILTVPAEGTRGAGVYWRSGFYHIARLAGVPIVLGYLDYPRRRGGLGPVLVPGRSVVADMDRIRDFYADKRGRYPELFTEPRLQEERAEHD